MRCQLAHTRLASQTSEHTAITQMNINNVRLNRVNDHRM